MEGVLDFDTIDMELDEDLLKKQSRRCRDEFLNSLSLDDEDEDFIIPLFENVEDDEAPVEEEPLDDEQEEEENVDEVVDEEENDSEAQFKYSTHDPNVKWNRMKPQEGERYESPQQLKLCLTNHAISKGYQIRFNKCDSVRLHCVCASDHEKFGCPYYVKASWMSTEKSFQIKKMYPHHTCVKNFNNGKLMGPQIQVNEEYNSEEMVDVDVMSDGDGLDMADMDYITQQITELRKSGYTDVDIMRCLGITKAHLEEFGYVAANVEGGLEGDGQGNEEEGGHGQGDGVEGGGERDGEKEDGEGDEGDGQEEDEEGVPVNDPVQQGHFGNNMKQRTRRPSERIILQKLKKKVVDPLGIGMCEDKALVID
uniref:Transposase MuDR plant domain-containing protein n=1 Tax=Lactuca sativa TaxID=4236 RepID=A0A9R1VGM7_LACSA|nr:hypothetical protein LSAT_V11C500289450 [Lactuca sativa]